MTDAEKEIQNLKDALGLATGIGDGFHLKADDGRTIAVIASFPFPDSRTAMIFAAWLRGALADPEGLADLIDAIEADEGTMLQ